MTAEQLLVDTWRNLPSDKQTQLLDFAEFLRTRQSTDLQQQTQKKRQPPASIAGKGKTLGDIVSPIVDEEDWECLK